MLGNVMRKTTTPQVNGVLKYQRAREMSLLFKKHADAYGNDAPVTLSEDTIDEVAADLNEAGFTTSEVAQFDEKPYYFIMDTKKVDEIHWFMRRFRNSGGWYRLKNN